jgi:hypothetical protein
MKKKKNNNIHHRWIMKRKLLTITFAILTSVYSPISNAILCPTNFNQIDIGDSMAQVIAQCGEPNQKETQTIPGEGPQEWVYFIPQTVATTSTNQMQGTLRTSISFDASGQAINLTVNGIGVGASTICGPTIQLGSTREAIKAACGNPNFVNKQVNSSTGIGAEPPPTNLTTFIYTQPPAHLLFKNGRLVSHSR